MIFSTLFMLLLKELCPFALEGSKHFCVIEYIVDQVSDKSLQKPIVNKKHVISKISRLLTSEIQSRFLCYILNDKFLYVRIIKLYRKWQ